MGDATRDYRMYGPSGSGRWFGRQYGLDLQHSTAADAYEVCVEIGINMTTLDPDVIYGCPTVRGLPAGGGPQAAYLNTMTGAATDDANGADNGITDLGNFNNPFGVVASMWIDRQPNAIMIWFIDISTAPTVGDTLLQATSLATLTVSAWSMTQGWVMGIDLNTGTGWDTTNTVTGGTMVPAGTIPKLISQRDTAVANVANTTSVLADGTATKPLICIGIRGLFVAQVIHDTGTGTNGAVTIGSNVTHNDDVRAYCAGNYHTGAGTGPDNVYGHAQTAGQGNAANVPESLIVYFNYNEPNIHVGQKQGTNAQGDQ